MFSTLRCAAVLTFSMLCFVGADSTLKVKQAPHMYCSFFNNRAPSAQPGLKNCTWFKEDSCCLQQEIEATFGRVKPLKGASPSCQKYINFLMCYICAPNQNAFYQNERLTVCKSFCDNLFSACGSATLKGSVIKDLYKNGEGFCRSRRFLVNTTQCFTFDESALKLSSSRAVQGNPLLVSIALTFLYISWLIRAASQCTSYQDPAPQAGINKRPSKKGTRLRLSGKSLSIGLPMHMEGHTTAGFTDLCRQCDSAMSNNLVKMQRVNTKHRSRLLFMLILLSTASTAHTSHAAYQTGSMPRLNTDIVRHWAKLVSKDLTDFAKEGLNYKELQRLYDDAEYTTEYINATEKLLQVREKLGM